MVNLLVAAVCGLAATTAPLDPPAADTVVVCPAPFRAALQPWLDYRQAQGHEIAVISAAESAGEVHERIRQLAGDGKLQHVLLIGDATGPLATPTWQIEAKVNIHWGSEPQIATDNRYGDLDGDMVPELAVGRLAADDPEQLSVMIEKIMAYERSTAEGAWRRRINFVAGVGGFGPIVDSVLEMATKKLLTDGIPASYETTMTYGSWRSPFCPDLRRFRATTLERLNEGCLFWVYLGHGQRTHLDYVAAPGSLFPIMSVKDTMHLRRQEASPIAIFLACYTGAFDGEEDCLAEQMIKEQGGPVAVFAGTRVTMPYAMAVMGTEMMQQYFSGRQETLGQLLRDTKRQMVGSHAEPDNDGVSTRRLLDVLAATLSPAPEQLAAERLEHVQLFNLLGDPLMRLPYPGHVELDVAESVHAGQTLVVRGRAAVDGACRVELVYPRDRSKQTPPVRARFENTHESLAAYDETYQQANDHCWVAEPVRVQNGQFRVELPVPAAASGPCYVRVFVDAGAAYAMGDQRVFVRQPLPDAAPAEQTAGP